MFNLKSLCMRKFLLNSAYAIVIAINGGMLMDLPFKKIMGTIAVALLANVIGLITDARKELGIDEPLTSPRFDNTESK